MTLLELEEELLELDDEEDDDEEEELDVEGAAATLIVNEDRESLPTRDELTPMIIPP